MFDIITSIISVKKHTHQFPIHHPSAMVCLLRMVAFTYGMNTDCNAHVWVTCVAGMMSAAMILLLNGLI